MSLVTSQRPVCELYGQIILVMVFWLICQLFFGSVPVEGSIAPPRQTPPETLGGREGSRDPGFVNSRDRKLLGN